MALNFPDNPSNGDTYSFGGKTYTYNSTKSSWSPSMDLLVPTYATANDLPSSGSAGSQAFVTATNRLYLWNGSGWYNIALLNTTPTISGVSSSYDLAIDGTATVITITAVDAEGLPITYSIASDTSGNIATVSQGTGASSNVFTITPSTNDANAGTFSLTFRASDGVNIASSIASFELAFKVVNSNYTTALITSVGANLADNNDFVDSSTNSHTITAAGNTTQNTFSPYRHGGYSTYFDGTTGTKLTTPAQFDFSGAFTAEFWFHIQTGKRIEIGSEKDVTPSDADYFRLGTNGSGYPFFQCRSDVVTVTTATGSTLVNDGAWHHIAGVRDASGNMTLYVDGVSAATATNNGNLGTSQTINIGAFDYESTGNDAWGTGYLRDVRISSNVRYSANFSVPTKALTSDSNTTLLTCHLPYFADGSTNNYTITVNGNVKTEPFGPYDYLKYASGTHGGSMYFDGTGDYLSAGTSSYNDTLSGDFCIEAWIYPTGTNDGTIIGNYLSGPNRGWSFRSFTSNNLYLYFQIDGGAQIVYQTPSNSVNPNAWNHVVWCRSGTDTSVFINGSRSDNRTLSGTSTGAGGVAISSLSQGFVGYHFTGHITNARIVNGSAVYDPSQTTLTVPTAPLTAITNTSLLLSGTNASIIDKAQRAENMILYGNTNSSTSQTKYLASSIYLDGTSDYIDLYSSGIANFGTGDFTIELWAYYNSIPGYVYLLETRNGTNSTTNCWSLAHNWMNNTTNDRLQFAATAVGDLLTANTAMPTGQWVHIAVARNGTSLKMFFDGVEVASATNSYDFNQNQIPIRVGARFSTEFFFDGYISDIRITKGLARYTANFTPPTAELKG